MLILAKHGLPEVKTCKFKRHFLVLFFENLLKGKYEK